MSADYPAINIVESNPYHPRPFVFTEIAVCLVDALRAQGLRSEHLVNRIDPSALSIVLGGTQRTQADLEHMDPRCCAIFNFEQLGSGSSLAGPDYVSWLASWLVLDYHDQNMEVLRRVNGTRQQTMELPIVPSASLVTNGDEAKSVDVLFYGTMNERRSQVLREVQAMGLSTEIVAGAYAAELAPAVRRARLVLHVHHYDTGLFPVARVLQPAVMGVPIVCENSVFSSLNDWSDSGIVFSDHPRLAAACKELLSDPARMQQCSARVHAFRRNIEFSMPIRAVLDALGQRTGPHALAHSSSSALPDIGNLARPPDHPPRPCRSSGQGVPEDEHVPLTDTQIEELLIREGAQPPEADLTAPALSIVRREPGQGRLGKWIAWVLMLVMLIGSAKYWMDWKV